MANSSIIDLLSKAENSETISLFEEILTFVKEIKPVLDKINTSIEENVKKMPAAAKKISKVTEATELATTEILDIVDKIFPKIDSLTEKIKEMHSDRLNIQKKILDFLQSIEKGLSGEIDMSSLLPEIQKAIKNQQEIIDSYSDKNIHQALEDLQSLSSDSTSIMISLQVQDITSQQLAAVKHLLDTIQNRLSEILTKFNNSDIQQFLKSSSNDEEDNNITTLHKEIAFDPQAVDAYDTDVNRQEMVDDIFNQNENDSLNEQDSDKNTSNDETNNSNKNEISDSEISSNELKSSSPESIEESVNSTKEEPKENKQEQQISDNNEKMNSEDINAMSSNNELDSDEEISQDDIDKLFAGG